MLKYLFIVIVFSFGLTLSAQDEMTYPRWRVGVTPTAMMNEYPAFQISLDRRLNERINLTTEYGYIFTSLDESQGYRLRPGVEFFLARSRWVSLAFGVHFTVRATEGRQVIITRATNGEFNFINYRSVQNTLAGMNLSNTLLFRLSERFYLEVGGGIGAGRETVFIPGGEIPGFRTTGNMPRTAATPIVYMHLNLSYAFAL